MHKDAFLYHADCRDALRQLPDDCIDSVVTDPPYALVSVVKRFGGANAAPAKGNDAYMRASAGFMGKTWDTGETAFSTEFWSEVLRVLKPGGHVVAFGASRGYHRMTCAIEDAGFEIRDSLMWVYGTGFPKSQDVARFIDRELGAESTIAGTKVYAGGHVQNSSADALAPPIGTFARSQDERHEYAYVTPQAQEFDGFGTALKPAFEPIVLARKPLSEGTVAANVLRWRTGALNIDASRIEAYDGASTARKPSLVKDTSAPFGKGIAMGGNGSDLGRWPTNVVHDGSDEVVGAFPTTGGGGTPREKSPNKGSNWAIGAERSSVPGGATYCDRGSAARFFYSAKASKADRAGSKHPTVKPIALMQWLARLVTPPGGVILDPFAGSGTTGAAALAEGFKVVLCEREDEYVADIRRRLAVNAAA